MVHWPRRAGGGTLSGVDEAQALRVFWARCRKHHVPTTAAELALAGARFDVRTGRVLARDPYRLAWRRLRQLGAADEQATDKPATA